MATETSKLTGDPNSHDISEFNEGMTTTCLCGSIQITINDKELFTKKRGHLCHCSNCRKVSGSYVSSNMAIESEKVVIEDLKGTLKMYLDYATNSGKCVQRYFCGTCGSPIKSQAEIYPGMTFLRMGLFPRIPHPECESFAAHRHPWQGKHGDMIQYEIVRGGKKLGE